MLSHPSPFSAETAITVTCQMSVYNFCRLPLSMCQLTLNASLRWAMEEQLDHILVASSWAGHVTQRKERDQINLHPIKETTLNKKPTEGA